jgi:hypothetical protein
MDEQPIDGMTGRAEIMAHPPAGSVVDPPKRSCPKRGGPTRD